MHGEETIGKEINQNTPILATFTSVRKMQRAGKDERMNSMDIDEFKTNR